MGESARYSGCGWGTRLTVRGDGTSAANPRERERIRAAGEAFVRGHHTFDARLPYLLNGAEWQNPLAATPAEVLQSA